MNSEMLQTYSWILPSLTIILLLTLIGSYYGFKHQKFSLMIATGMMQTIISPLMPAAVGPIVLGLGITQFYMGMVNLRRTQPAKE
ncbi:hypothetical protein SAMN05216353_13225 [Halobacillus alkaliphilus]|uniref:Uncharacterized protein n=1 Tax=Halobacillus alkaliphilus TaxID=396056 RepID=A0A1I2QJR9_9BACI|nr:hypothetical protein [Halobacillus alkaliphilus]SFG28568.1 hypothetical protein SAMN05216353_13225 [Halobacillus alkaliphilus]